jgi:hypothetical protein
VAASAKEYVSKAIPEIPTGSRMSTHAVRLTCISIATSRLSVASYTHTMRILNAVR